MEAGKADALEFNEGKRDDWKKWIDSPTTTLALARERVEQGYVTLAAELFQDTVATLSQRADRYRYVCRLGRVAYVHIAIVSTNIYDVQRPHLFYEHVDRAMGIENPIDFDTLIDIAFNYARIQDMETAMHYAKQAYELKPFNPR